MRYFRCGYGYLRLFSFFILMEKHTPTLVSKSLQEMKQIAKDVVWPALGLDKTEIDEILNAPVLSKDERLQERKMRFDAIWRFVI
jgi:hypothetical protein